MTGKRIMIVILVVLVVLLAAGVVYYLATGKPPGLDPAQPGQPQIDREAQYLAAGYPALLARVMAARDVAVAAAAL